MSCPTPSGPISCFSATRSCGHSFHLTEVSPKALSNRWKNLKKQHFTPPMDPRFASQPDEA